MSEITILTHDARWARLRPSIRKAIVAALKQYKNKHVAITAVLTNDAEIKMLNHQYRSKNKPTNVLSFETGGEVEGIYQLGDVVMSYDTLMAEARLQKKSLKVHATHLAIHGTLHLLGYDHENDRDAQAMETLEISLLAQLGIANPYESD